MNTKRLTILILLVITSSILQSCTTSTKNTDLSSLDSTTDKSASLTQDFSSTEKDNSSEVYSSSEAENKETEQSIEQSSISPDETTKLGEQSEEPSTEKYSEYVNLASTVDIHKVDDDISYLKKQPDYKTDNICKTVENYEYKLKHIIALDKALKILNREEHLADDSVQNAIEELNRIIVYQDEIHNYTLKKMEEDN